MSRPEVSLFNAQKMYEFYGNHTQNPLFARYVAYPLLSKIFKPKITVDEGLEDAVADELRNDRKLIIGPNHLTGDDQYAAGAALYNLKVFKPLLDNIFIPTEPSLSSRPGIKGKVLRWAVDEMGSIPVIRLEDLNRQGIGITSEMEERHKEALLLLDEVEVKKLVEGPQHMSAFFEGKRNRTDHRRVQALKKGVAHTAIRAAQDVCLSFVPFGLYYGGEPTDYSIHDVPSKRKPTLHIGMPIQIEPNDTPDDLITLLHPEMQRCVDLAVAHTPAV